MNPEPSVIWRRGDGEIPERAKIVVEAARDELLLMSLQLPIEIVNLIRYNADKNAQTVNSYISTIVADHFETA